MDKDAEEVLEILEENSESTSLINLRFVFVNVVGIILTIISTMLIVYNIYTAKGVTWGAFFLFIFTIVSLHLVSE